MTPRSDPQRTEPARDKEDEPPAGLHLHRLPQTAKLEGATLEIATAAGSISLRFADGVATWEQDDGLSGADPYDAVEVAPNAFFVDIWRRSHSDREALTLILDRASGHALSVMSAVRDGALPKGSVRVGQELQSATVGDNPSGPVPVETRDLLGKRLIAEYSDEYVFEHIYVNSTRCCWQCLRGELPGSGDCDEASYWRFGENQYVFAFREELAECASVFFFDLDDLRSTGKFLYVEEDGEILNAGLGARLHMLPGAQYPDGMEPR